MSPVIEECDQLLQIFRGGAKNYQRQLNTVPTCLYWTLSKQAVSHSYPKRLLATHSWRMWCFGKFQKNSWDQQQMTHSLAAFCEDSLAKFPVQFLPREEISVVCEWAVGTVEMNFHGLNPSMVNMLRPSCRESVIRILTLSHLAATTITVC